MKVEVHFARRNSLTYVFEHYEHVADVDAPDHYDIDRALEYAFRRCQNLDGSWSMGWFVSIDGALYENPDFDPNVTVVAPLSVGLGGRAIGHRSCSVGDRMVIGDRTFEVADFGFEEI